MDAAEGRMAHNNGWNNANGMASWNGNHVFDLFDTIPLIPLQPLPRARPPQLRGPQPPVVNVQITVCVKDRVRDLWSSVEDAWRDGRDAL